MASSLLEGSSMVVRLIGLLVLPLLVPACGGGADDDAVGGDSAALTAAQCVAPRVSTFPRLDAAGRPIPGTAKTSLDGCILRPGESGAAVLSRATGILNDTARFGTLTDETGAPVFKRFVPAAENGALATGLVQEVDVALNMAFTPTTRIRVTRQDLGGGRYRLSIVNLTPLKATLAVFPVTVVQPENLRAQVELRIEDTGVRVFGSTEVTLDAEKQRAAESAQLARQLYGWLTDQLKTP